MLQLLQNMDVTCEKKIHFVRNVLYCSYGLFFYEAEITSGHIR